MNRNGCEMKRVSANLRHCPVIFQEGLGKTTKNLPTSVGFEPETFRKQTGSTIQLLCNVDALLPNQRVLQPRIQQRLRVYTVELTELLLLLSLTQPMSRAISFLALMKSSQLGWCWVSTCLQYARAKSCLGSCSISCLSRYFSPGEPRRGTLPGGSCWKYSSICNRRSFRIFSP